MARCGVVPIVGGMIMRRGINDFLELDGKNCHADLVEASPLAATRCLHKVPMTVLAGVSFRPCGEIFSAGKEDSSARSE